METGKDERPPIIVIKKKGGHGGHHGGSWKVAFADFMTAMMAFFLVMWIIGQSQAVKVGIGGYFRDPLGFKEKVGMGLLEGTRSGLNKDETTGLSDSDRREREQIVRDALKKTGEELVEKLLSVPGIDNTGDQIDVELVDEGLRILLMESNDSTFFDIGSADVSAKGLEVLSTIGRVLGQLDFDIAIEGHTDSRQYANNRYTNWELSSDRANTARRVLEHNGVDSDRIVLVRAYADKELRYAENPYDPRNRRVAIVVLNKFALQRFTDLTGDKDAPESLTH